MCCLKCILINHIVAHSRESCWCSSMNILPSFLFSLFFFCWVVFFSCPLWLVSWCWSSWLFQSYILSQLPTFSSQNPSLFCWRILFLMENLSFRFSTKNCCIFSFPRETASTNLSRSCCSVLPKPVCRQWAEPLLLPSFLHPACASCLSHWWHLWGCFLMTSRGAPPCVWMIVRLSCLFIYPLFSVWKGVGAVPPSPDLDMCPQQKNVIMLLLILYYK